MIQALRTILLWLCIAGAMAVAAIMTMVVMAMAIAWVFRRETRKGRRQP